MVSAITGRTRVFTIVLPVAALAACAAFPLLSAKSTPRADLSAAIERAALKGDREKIVLRALKGDKQQMPQPTFVVAVTPEVYAAKHPVMAALDKELRRRDATYGLASFYGSGSRTASGEKFNPRDMTAAHRHLPFGTRVRVTDVKTGKSVMVRINDRGPFIAGRVVDVSPAAAEKLGMVGRGVAQVKLDLVTN